MELAVMLRETIKPSSPTPPHLKHVKLSLIDQSLPPTFYASAILFYSAQGDVHRFHNTNMSDRFKKALSEVLTEFYPLAGKFNSTDHLVECNDAGLEYTEARVKAPLTLAQLLSCPNPEQLDQLQPHDVYNYGTGFRGLSAVQVSIFEECGGMAIGFSLSHILTDASCLGVFINTWAAAVARDGVQSKTNISATIFDAASVFPPRDMPAQKYDDVHGAKRCTVKRFVFPQLEIDNLKAKFTYQHPTRVEVVSALLLKCLIKAFKSRSSKPVVAGIGINLRSRMSLPLPGHYFGTLVLSLLLEREPDSLDEMGKDLRRLIKEMDRGYIERLQADNGSLLVAYLDQQAKLECRVTGVTSWCKFPFYEADFGWGVPTWAAAVRPHWEDCIVLMDAKNGDGIEAWVTLDQEDMALFESDDQLLEFARSNPAVSEF